MTLLFDFGEDPESPIERNSDAAVGDRGSAPLSIRTPRLIEDYLEELASGGISKAQGLNELFVSRLSGEPIQTWIA